jgi:hypothetical protein
MIGCGLGGCSTWMRGIFGSAASIAACDVLKPERSTRACGCRGRQNGAVTECGLWSAGSARLEVCILNFEVCISLMLPCINFKVERRMILIHPAYL